MRWRAAMVLLLLTAVHANAQVAAPEDQQPLREALNIGISSTEIAIVPDFAGTDVTVFGAIENVDPALLAKGGYDIVVALEGPKTPLVVREKERVLGLWINRGSERFSSAPASKFTVMTSSDSFERITSRFSEATMSRSSGAKA